MFNRSNRKEAIEKFEHKKSIYTIKHESLLDDANELFELRKELKKDIDLAWDHINKLRNVPGILMLEIEEIRIGKSRYSELYDLIEREAKKNDIKSGGTAAAGLATAVGVSALGPTAAMGIAMTFGTASTGAAIASLSGAAATNAALAWLGGGALTAGGAGMAGGASLLALAGPLGWAIGGVSLIGAGVFSNSKNKKIIQEANDKTNEIRAEIRTVEGLKTEIKEIEKNIYLVMPNIRQALGICSSYGEYYDQMTESEKYDIGSLINNTNAAVELLNRGIGDNK